MKAAYINQTGPASVIRIGDLPEPRIQAGQVLVRVESVSVNPIDIYIRSGAVKAELPDPYIIGCDLCGVIEAVGEGTSRFKVGDRVWGSNQGLSGRQGTSAEFCAVEEKWLYPLPTNVNAATAAAGALVGITAHLGLFLHAGLTSGEVLFVNGGTGGVGSSVVQFAKAAGATVITTAGSAHKAEECLSIGADHVIQYQTENVAARLAEITQTTGPINVWFETLRNPSLDLAVSCMAKRGRIILMAGRDARPEFPVGPFYVKDLRMMGFAMFNASPEEQQLAAMEINQWMSAGKFIPRISRILSLSRAADAHELQEANTLHGAGTLAGKIVLNITDEQ
ncbi:MAG: NADPH:quinone reductase [Planctomycetaceae bacterium]|nr:NADPH:quinone reductase [Planctomycetaceae bacterium]